MQTLADIPRHHASERPQSVALVFEDRQTTYAELDRQSNRIANALRAEGVGPGSRVAILAKNSDDFFKILFGAVKARAVLVPVNFRLAPPEVAFVVNDATAEVLFVDEAHAGLVAEIEGELKTVKKIVHLDRTRDGWAAYGPWREAAPDTDPDIEVLAEDVAIQMYTSGTTGLPKGAQITHGSFIYAIDIASRTMGQWSDKDVNLVCMPLFHIAGSEWGTIGLYNGARDIILPEVDAGQILHLISTERVTKVLFVPAVILFMLQHPTCGDTDFASLELVVYGASPIPLDLLAQAVGTLKCDFAQVYGLTETMGAITYLPPSDHDPDGSPRMKSCGYPMEGVEIRIVDADGAECEAGVVGEIACRTRQNMKGYWNQPDATARSIRDGWFYSGDAGYVDEAGYVYIHDRIKDMIVSGGENVYPAEVESALFKHDDIADVAVIGVPDDRWGEAVKAIVVRKEGSAVTEADIQDFARAHIAGYKVPKSVDFVDALPRNPSGKILKRELRSPYWEGQDRQVH